MITSVACTVRFQQHMRRALAGGDDVRKTVQKEKKPERNLNP